MKKVVTKRIPSYRWVVEDVCAQCEPESPAGAKSADRVPPAPAAEMEAPAKPRKGDKGSN
jgi:hypothetical protein